MKDFKVFQGVLSAFFSSHDMQTALQQIFGLLRQHLPIEAMAFDRYVPGQGLLVTCVVTLNGVNQIERLIPCRPEEEAAIRSFERARTVLVHRNSRDESVATGHARVIEPYLPERARGYLVVPLARADKVIGHLALVGTEPDCFCAEHARLMHLLTPVCALAMSNQMEIDQMRASRERADEEKSLLEREVFTLIGLGGIVGMQGGLRDIGSLILNLIDKETPVLLFGEPGTGKELVADAIYRNSLRHDRPFIKVACGNIPENLLESELFGHEEDVRAGEIAVQPGRLEQAHKGSLFLDEIGELPPQTQERLLRALRDGRVERVGGSRPVPVDVRLIAATTRDLSELRHAGPLCEGMLLELQALPMHMPPLRERQEDIPLLIKHIVERFSRRMGIAEPDIRTDSMAKVMGYAWPGNVRELEEIVERAISVHPTGPVDVGLFLPREHAVHETGADTETLQTLVDACVVEVLDRLGAVSGAAAMAGGSFLTLDEAMAAHIGEALRLCNGRLYGPHGAARLLGVNYNTLRNKMKKLGVDPKVYRPASQERERGDDEEV